jgi:hypothetical protein
LTYREIPFRENQRLANEVLRRFGFDESSDLPIDPELIIRQMGMDFIPVRGLKKNFGIKGCVVKYGDALQILIDEYHYENEPESSILTLGEELGHSVLHLVDIDSIKSIKQWMREVHRNTSRNAYIHSQARLFASNLILPAFVFDAYVLGWVESHLGEIQRFTNLSEDGLSSTIGFLMEDELEVSSWIIGITLGRWPNPAIKQITAQFPELLSKRVED